MKRLLVVLCLAFLLITTVGATQHTYQMSSDYNTYSNCTRTGTPQGTCDWYDPTGNGGNADVSIVSGVSGHDTYVVLANSLQTNYGAATLISSCTAFGASRIALFDGSKNVLGSWTITTTGRYEVITTGTTASLYRNGIFISTIAITQNPSYIGWGAYSWSGGASGCAQWDDVVYGTTENKNIFGMPSSVDYIIKKDTINPSASGFYWQTNNTVISNSNMTTEWGKGLTNESINIKIIKAYTGEEICNFTTTAGTMAGSHAWPLADCFFNKLSTTYGLYRSTTGGLENASTDSIPYVSAGATITFNSNTYGRGNTAQMTYSVDGAYWDTSTYTYHVKLYSASTGAILHSYQLTSSTGTDTYTFASTDPEGVVYAVVTRTLNTGGADDWLAYDYATLTANAKFVGYVNDAQTKLPITAANVSLVQGSTISNNITPAAGSYTSAEFIPGTPISVNVTASGYRQYTYSFTPLIGKTVNLNMTLIPMTPAVNGLAIGGVVRDTAYGQPIDSVLAESINATIVSQSTSNSAGYYLINDTLNLSYYSVHGSKAGYSNSSIYNVSVNGSVTTFTQNDIWMAGQYNRTFHITDSATGFPINVVLITSSSGDTYTTTGGTGYITESLGIYTISFSSTGYDVRTISYVFDADASSDVQLTLSTPANPPTPVYIPQQVRFTLVNLSGYPVSNVMVTATPLNFTAPSNWAQLLFSISPTVNITGTAVSGFTDSTGSFVAPMLQSINYGITMVRSPDVNLAITLMPQQLHYTITIPESYVIIPAPLGNVVVYSLQNASIDSAHQYVNMSYSDASSSGTDNLQFAVYNITGAMIASANYTGASASSQTFSQIITVSQGQSYSYGICANQSQYGWINQSSSFKLANQIALIGAAPSWVEQWIAISLIVLFAAFFSIFNKTYGLIGIPLFTWFFQFYLGWLPSNWTSTLTLAVMLAIGIALYIRMAENKIQ